MSIHQASREQIDSFFFLFKFRVAGNTQTPNWKMNIALWMKQNSQTWISARHSPQYAPCRCCFCIHNIAPTWQWGSVCVGKHKRPFLKVSFTYSRVQIQETWSKQAALGRRPWPDTIMLKLWLQENNSGEMKQIQGDMNCLQRIWFCRSSIDASFKVFFLI